MTAIFPQHDTLAASVARLWLRVYTLGVARHLRERREQQLESDLWEHQTDRIGDGVAPSMVGLEVIGRTLRGMPADLFWRFQLEGPKMDFKIPFERVTGALFIGLLVVTIGATSINGYDTDANGWETTVRDLGDRSSLERNVTTTWFIICGLALVGAAAGLYLGLQTRARILGAISTALLAVAGTLVVVAAASYGVMSDLADQYVDGPGDPSLVSTSRAFALAAGWLGLGAIVALVLSILGIVSIVVRERLVPRWLGWLAALGVGLLVGGALMETFVDNDSVWLITMGGLYSILLALLISGAAMLLGYRSTGSAGGEALATP